MEEEQDRRVLAIDVGAGTQDILIYQPGIAIENNIKMVLPSQTVLVGRRIRHATEMGRDLFLSGTLMGGGASSQAVREHLKAGYRVYALPEAAKTIRDDLDQVRELGVIIVNEPPPGLVEKVETQDVDLYALRRALAFFGISIPDRSAIAVQDHGECFDCSQRRFRFQMWESFLDDGGQLVNLAYRNPPEYLTRMRAVQDIVPGAVLMDTAGAAIWGALQDHKVAAHQQEGLIIVNAGNEHTLGALVRGERIWGLFEQHTGLMDTDSLGDYVDRLRAGTLTNDEVYERSGHGCRIDPDYKPGEGFGFVALTGPNWSLAEGLGYHRAAPHGDMMIAGCFGLVAAAERLWREL